MATDTLRYPLDPTGTNEINKVVGELHPLVIGQALRVIAPKYGAFYKAGLVVVDAANGTPMSPGVQYYVAYRYDVPTERFKQDVCALIVITDSGINAVSINYQVVGEDFSWSAQHVVDMLNRRVSDDRSLDWAPLLEPVENTPSEDLLYFKGSVSTSAQAVTAINRLAAAKMENDPRYMQQLKDYVAYHANKIGEDAGNSVEAQITEHIADPLAHPQYARIAAIGDAVPMVKRPINIAPADGALNVSRLSFTMVVAGYYGLYEIAQNAAQFQIATDAQFSDVVYDNLFPVATVSGQFNGSLTLATRYYWRCRQRNAETVWSEWSAPTSFTSNASGIATPAMSSPTNDQANVGETPTFTTNNFAVIGGTDTHVSTDWMVTTAPDGLGDVIWSSLNDTVNKTSIRIAAAKLRVNSKYYVRARHNAASLGPSAWASSVGFTTAPVFVPVDIGAAYGGGFYAGTITRNAKDYAIVMAPKASEQSLALQTVVTKIDAYSLLDAKANTDLFFAATNSPAANYVRGMTYGGYTDWQIPSKGVMDVLYQNVRPSIATLPAAFKAGGAEALSATSYYWSSTAYDWVRDDSYTTGGQPIYGTVQVTQTYNSRSESADCSLYEGIFHYPYSLSRVSQETFSPYWYTYTCTGKADQQKVVGYTEGNKVTVMTQLYQAYGQVFGASAAATWQAKTTAGLVRAVRLVDIAAIGADPIVGAPYGGGFYGGRIVEDGVLYDLIVAPKATGETTLAIRDSDISENLAISVYNGAANTAAYQDASHPAYMFAKNATIGGFSDWFVPSRDELEILYRYFKPGTTMTQAGTRFVSNTGEQYSPERMGFNQYARPIGVDYVDGTPTKTAYPLYVTGGAEAFSEAAYFTSTEFSNPLYNSKMWAQSFASGVQSTSIKSAPNKVRLVRKVKVVNPPAEIPTGVVGEAFAGGYYAGQYSDGYCTYALVVAPKAYGEFNDIIGDYTPVSSMTSYIDGQYNTSLLPNVSPAGIKVRSLSIAGFSDWYIPSFYEMEIIYRNLKPTADANSDVAQTLTDGSNSISAGTNKYSVPTGAPYTTTDPAQTTNALFKAGGKEAFVGYYAASTYAKYDPSSDYKLGWIKTMTGPATTWNSAPGVAWQQPVTSNYAKRAVRRVAVSPQIVQAASAQVPTVPGTAWAGGIYVGRMIVNGENYALVAAPKATGQKAFVWKTTNTADIDAFGDLIDGLKNTNQYQDAAHPACVWARSLNISGCKDWYLPARDELEMLYRYLKPDKTSNYTAIDRVDSKNGTVVVENAHGTNNNSVPTGTRYLVGNPAQVSNPIYQTGGAEALSTTGIGSSTVQTTILPLAPYTWQHLTSGRQVSNGFTSNVFWRAVRKVKIVG